MVSLWGRFLFFCFYFFTDGGSCLVWIVGHSYVYWGARRADVRPTGRQMGIPREEATLHWIGVPGLMWSRVIPEIERYVALDRPPQKRNREDQYVHHGEVEAISKAELESVPETKDEEKEQYVQHEEMVATNKADSGSVTETKYGEKDHCVQDEEVEAANIVKLTSATETRNGEDQYVHHGAVEATSKAEPQSIPETTDGEKDEEIVATNKPESESVTETKYGEKDHCVQDEEVEAANIVKLTSATEIFAYIEHLFKLMSEQQKPQQDHQCHILKQLLDMQREFYVQQNNRDYQQLYQQDQLLQFKEIQNHQLQMFEDLLQQIKNLIQQQNNLISGQLLQQQQDFQAKLMKDLAKQTEEQVKMLLQTSNKCETHQTSYNKDPPCGKSSFAFTTDPPNAFNRVSMSSGYSQDQGSSSQESFKNFKVQSRDTPRNEVFSCETVGQEFCKQFYPVWNSQNPSYGQRENIPWGPHLFWDNATAEMINFHNGQHTLDRYEGFECVSDFLLKLTNQERLEFRPSIDNERFKCVNSKHGLVVVAVTGIILREGRSLGIFEQRFGLIPGLETKSLKIQFTNLKTEYFNHMENSVTAPNLNYTTEQLENM